MFLFLTQLRFALIVTQSMIISLVNGYDHYVILSVDCVNAQRLESMAKFDECLSSNHCNCLFIFDRNDMNLMHIVTTVTNQV